MEINKQSIEQLRELLAGGSKKIVIIAHTNPDGDAVGSSLAWAGALESQGHSVHCIVPNKFPSFLNSVPNIDRVLNYRNDELGICDKIIEAADIIFCLDFNSLTRLDALGEAIEKLGTKAKKVLIDHHLEPQTYYDVMFSYPESSSTCFLVYCIIEEMWGTDPITKDIAECIYVGMMTDTGNFSFSALPPKLYRTLATLVEKGIEIPYINNYVYNSYTESRARLFGYVINRKMEIIHKGSVSYMSLTEQEMRRFYFQQGDSEGFVNYPLTIKKMKLSVMFSEQHNFIRVSLRSRGDVDVNLFANKYFEGGGHKNAAGGKSYLTMDQTIEKFKKAIAEFASAGGLK